MQLYTAIQTQKMHASMRGYPSVGERQAMALSTTVGVLFAYVVFQDSLLSPLASIGGSKAYMTMRRMPDLIGILASVIFLLLTRGRRLTRALPFAIIFLMISAWMVYSGTRAGATNQGFIELWAVGRCWPLFLAVSCQSWVPAVKKRFFTLVIICTTIESCIGVMEFLIPPLSGLLLPNFYTETGIGELTYVRQMAGGFVSGSFIENVGFAYTALIGFAVLITAEPVWMPRRALRWKWPLLLLHGAAVGISGSLTVAVLLLFLLIIRRVNSKRLLRLGAFAGIAVIGAIAGLVIWGEPLALGEFVQAAEAQRLGAFYGIVEMATKADFGTILMGVGPSDYASWQALLFTSTPGFFLNNGLAIQDIYWPSYGLYYGIIGLALLIFLFTMLCGRLNRTPKGAGRQLCFSFLACIFVAGWFNQVLEFRPIAFFFWPMAGMLIQRGKKDG